MDPEPDLYPPFNAALLIGALLYSESRSGKFSSFNGCLRCTISFDYNDYLKICAEIDGNPMVPPDRIPAPIVVSARVANMIFVCALYSPGESCRAVIYCDSKPDTQRGLTHFIMHYCPLLKRGLRFTVFIDH